MRSHPVAGVFFLLLGTGLFLAGALGRWSMDLPGPLPPSIVMPFILWQFAVWSLLFGIFFLRSRGPRAAKPRRQRFAL